MSEEAESRSAGVAAYYDRAAGNIPSFTVRNYGYTDATSDARVPATHPERCMSIQCGTPQLPAHEFSKSAAAAAAVRGS